MAKCRFQASNLRETPIFYGKIHYFYGHFQLQTVSSPEGTGNPPFSSPDVLQMSSVFERRGTKSFKAAVSKRGDEPGQNQVTTWHLGGAKIEKSMRFLPIEN